MKTKLLIAGIWGFIVLFMSYTSLYSQCNQETNIYVGTISNSCPSGEVVYKVTYSSQIPNGFNSICYGYYITYNSVIVESESFGPIDQQVDLNNPFIDEIDVTIDCNQGLTLFINAWANHACGGEACHFPHTKTVVLSPLPVTLEKYEAVSVFNGILLKWSTAVEINNKGFYIEHSNNSEVWKEIGFVEGYRTSDTKKEYRFLHEFPNNGIHYYRLKQIDFDNKYNYSKIVSALYQNEDIFIYPNLVSDFINAYSNKETSFRIYDSMGKFIKSGGMGPEVNTINVTELNKGLYVIITENQKSFIFFKN